MKYKCLVCGAIIDSPDECPVCGAMGDQIVPYVEEQPEAKKKQYRCQVCGAIIDNPDKCPVCGARSERIKPLEEGEAQPKPAPKPASSDGKKQYVCESV